MRKLLTAVSLVVLMSLPSMAQETTLPKDSTAPAAQPETAIPPAPQPETTAPPAAQPELSVPPAPQAAAPAEKMPGEKTKTAAAASFAGEISAKDLLKQSIKNPANETVGDINDINLGSDGKIAVVIVGVGGFLGMGEKNVSVPFDQLSFSQDKDGNLLVTMTATKESLQAAPEWKKS